MSPSLEPNEIRYSTGAAPRLVLGSAFTRRAAFFIFCCCFVLGVQSWIGDATIYSGARASERELMHWRILHNQAPPGGSWGSVGSNGVNIRIGVVYLAEWVRELTGLRLGRVYKLIDTVALIAFLPLLFSFVRRWANRATAMAILAGVCALLPLTYFLYYYHPWDRLSTVAWLIGFWLIATNRPWWLAALLLPATLVKYDIGMLAAVYWLTWVDRKHWMRVSLLTTLCVITGIGTFVALRIMLPGGFESRSLLEQISSNIHVLSTLTVAWPPLLFFAPLAIPVSLGVRRGDRTVRTFAGFGVFFILFAAITVNLAEVRALTPALIALLPAAAIGLEGMLTQGPVRRERRRAPERSLASRVATGEHAAYSARR